MNQNTVSHVNIIMNQPQSEKTDLYDYDPDADREFRQPPQVLAIVVLILGLLCFLALFKTMFWVFPIVTAVLGTVSLVSLAHTPEKIGRKAALIGLALAVFFGSWAAGRYFSRQQWLYVNARRNAEAWLKLVQENKLREAHQLHLHTAERIAGGVTLDEYYANQEFAQSQFNGFFDGIPLNEFIKVASRATVEFVRFEAFDPMGSNDDVMLRYVARYEEDGQPKEIEMRIVMRRSIHPMTGQCVWAVYQVLAGEDL